MSPTPVTTPEAAEYRRLLEAWNNRRASEFAALFAPDGNVVGFDGSLMNGREEIEATLAAIFANHPTAAYVGIIREVRTLGPGVSLLRAVVGMVPPGAREINPAVNAIQSAVFVERDGGFEIALFQNTPAAFHGRPQLVEALTAELSDVLRTGETVRGPEQ